MSTILYVTLLFINRYNHTISPLRWYFLLLVYPLHQIPQHVDPFFSQTLPHNFWNPNTSLSPGAVSNSDVGGHGSPLFPVSCSFDDLDFTDFQQLAEAFHEVQPWSSFASLALNFPSDYDVLKSMLSHDMSQETHLSQYIILYYYIS